MRVSRYTFSLIFLNLWRSQNVIGMDLRAPAAISDLRYSSDKLPLHTPQDIFTCNAAVFSTLSEGDRRNFIRSDILFSSM